MFFGIPASLLSRRPTAISVASGVLAVCVVTLALLAFSSQREPGSPLREWPGRRLSFDPGEIDVEQSGGKEETVVRQENAKTSQPQPAKKSPGVAVAFEPQHVEPDSHGPQTSSVRCLATSTDRNACHFQNLYFDTHTGHFAFFSEASQLRTQPWQLPRYMAEKAINPVTQEEVVLAKIREVEAEERKDGTYEPLEFKQVGFLMDWFPEDPPSGSDVVEMAQNVIMRKRLRSRSFGHLLRDNMRAIAELAGYFGVPTSSLQWVPHDPEIDAGPGNEITSYGIISHYMPLITPHPAVTWQDVLEGAESASPGARYIRFREFIMADKTHLLNFWPGDEANCAGSPNRWQPLRDAAFQLHGIHPVPAQELNHTRIVVLDSLGHERGMNNTHEIMHSLRTRWKQHESDEVFYQQHSAVEQLKMLASTSVLISNVGSRAFRMVFMPRGAQVIMVGAPMAKVHLKAGDVDIDVQLPDPNKELNACWKFVNFVDVVPYNVETEEEIIVAPPRQGKLWDEDRDERGVSKKQQTFRLWDARIIMDTPRIMSLVEGALKNLGKA